MSTTQEPAERFAELPSGVRICYRTDGEYDGKPLILVAGLGQQLTVWPQRLVDALVGDGYFVVRLDNRDAGRSTKVERPAPGKLRLMAGRARPDAYTLRDMADDLLGLIDHLRLDRVHLVGQSMGGMIAQTVAAQAPSRVRSLVSIYSTTGDHKVGQASLRTKLMLMGRAARTVDEAVDRHVALTRHLAGRGFAIDEDVERAYAAEAWERAGGANSAGFARQIQAIMASGDRTAEVATITAPTLVVHGDRDPIVHPTGGEATARAVAGARHVVVPGMGHHLAPTLVPRLFEEIVGVHRRAEAGSVADTGERA